MGQAERLHNKIEATKLAVLNRDHWQCVVCGEVATQCGHVLPRDVLHLGLFGSAIINHPANMKAVCGLAHNAMVQISHKGHPLAANQWADVVRSIIEGNK